MGDFFESTKNTRPILKGSFRFIRSDVPTDIKYKEYELLLSNNILTVVDLRSEKEREQKPCPLKDKDVFTYYCMPVTGGDTVPGSCDDVSVSYINMVDRDMWNVIGTIVNAPTNVLYFCNAGKDRTGVVSAILLHLLGYDEEYIVADYMKSLDNLRYVLETYSKSSPDIDIDVITPKREYIEKFLHWLAKNVQLSKYSLSNIKSSRLEEKT